MDEYGPTDKEAALQKRAGDAVQVITTRYIIWIVAGTVPLMVALGGWGGNRIITTLDQAVERQVSTAREVVEIKGQVKSLQDLNTAAIKTITDRFEDSSKVLNDRQTAQAGWLQQLSTKVEDLAKYVYQKVR